MDPIIADLILRVTKLEVQLSAVQTDVKWLTQVIGCLVFANVGSIALNSFFAYRNNKKKE